MSPRRGSQGLRHKNDRLRAYISWTGQKGKGIVRIGMLENRNHGHFSPRGRPFPAPDRGEIQTKMAQEICSERM